MPAPYQGGCQCGAVRYEIAEEPATMYLCHCVDCQHQSASAFGMSLRIAAPSFRLTKGTLKKFITHGESGRAKTCTFCPECGTRIYHAFDEAAARWFTVKPGTLDDKYAFTPVAHIWTRSAQPWFVFPDDMPKFDKQPPELDTLEKLWAARLG